MSRTTRFSDGMGLDHRDLNQTNQLIMRRLFDEAWYSLALAVGQYGTVGDEETDFNTRWLAGALVRDKAWVSSPYALAATPVSGFDIKVLPGLVGIYSGATFPTVGLGDADQADNAAHEFRVGQLDGEVTINHTNSAGIVTERVDIVSVGVTEIAAGDANRSFEDAVTGALTSQSFDLRTQWVVDLQLHEGVDGAGDPAIPAGRVPLYRARVGPSVGNISLNAIEDMAWPLGPVSADTVYGENAIAGLATKGNGVAVLANTDEIVIPSVQGAPTRRLLGANVHGQGLNDLTLTIGRLNALSLPTSGSPGVNPPSIAASPLSFSADNQDRSMFLFDSTSEPVWGTGYGIRTRSTANGVGWDERESVAIRGVASAAVTVRMARFLWVG